MNDLYRLVYTSLNQLEGSEGERATAVAEILETSKRNNGKVGVTGALLFNGGCFAQVLEGPRKAVETTFERIQRDRRHGEVSVLQCESVVARGFPNWSMAFVGHSRNGRAMWDAIASKTGFDPSRLEGDQLFATLRAIVLEEEGSAPEEPSRPEAEVERKLNNPFDGNRVRSELQEQTPMAAPRVASVELSSRGVVDFLRSAGRGEDGGRSGSASSVEVLKAALEEERERTTDLRRSLDEARIALAAAKDVAQTLRRSRDHWAGRARMLASALVQEPEMMDLDEERDLRDAERLGTAAAV